MHFCSWNCVNWCECERTSAHDNELWLMQRYHHSFRNMFQAVVVHWFILVLLLLCCCCFLRLSVAQYLFFHPHGNGYCLSLVAKASTHQTHIKRGVWNTFVSRVNILNGCVYVDTRYSVDSSDFNAQHISIIKNYSMTMCACVRACACVCSYVCECLQRIYMLIHVWNACLTLVVPGI